MFLACSVAGTWEGACTTEGYSYELLLEIEEAGGELSGTGRFDGIDGELSGVHLGDEVDFDLSFSTSGVASFTGTVDGDRMSGDLRYVAGHEHILGCELEVFP